MLKRLKEFHFPSPLNLWDKAHLSRRAGVLIVLTPCGHDLNVLLTVRNVNMSYGGDAAFPGGKADSLDESPLDVALREAKEEVDLDPSSVEFVCYMPGYVSSKMLMVVPSIVYSRTAVQATAHSTAEVSKVFTMPLSRFLQKEGHSYYSPGISYFKVLAHDKRVGEPMYERVWGLTASILIDLARVAFDRAPEFDDEKRPAFERFKILEKMAERGTLQKPQSRSKL